MYLFSPKYQQQQIKEQIRLKTPSLGRAKQQLLKQNLKWHNQIIAQLPIDFVQQNVRNEKQKQEMKDKNQRQNTEMRNEKQK